MSSKAISVDDARKNGIPLPPISSESRDEEAKQKATPKSEPVLEPEPKINNPYEEPYEYSGGGRTDTLKGLQCIAFLLEWGSEIGNENLDGWLANGLARAIRKAAHDVQYFLYTRDEVVEAGDDPLSLLRKRQPKQS